MSKGNRNRQQRQSSPSGYQLNSTERKKLYETAKAAVLRQSAVMSVELDAAWVLLLHNELDLPVEECHRLYKLIEANHKDLREYYELNPMDGMGWLYVQKCKDKGMNIDEWSKEPPV